MPKVDKYALLGFDDYLRLIKSHEKGGGGITAAKTLFHSNEGGLSEAPPAPNKQEAGQSPKEAASDTPASKTEPPAKTSKASAESGGESGDWSSTWENLHFAK